MVKRKKMCCYGFMVRCEEEVCVVVVSSPCGYVDLVLKVVWGYVILAYCCERSIKRWIYGVLRLMEYGEKNARWVRWWRIYEWDCVCLAIHECMEEIERKSLNVVHVKVLLWKRPRKPTPFSLFSFLIYFFSTKCERDKRIVGAALLLFFYWPK